MPPRTRSHIAAYLLISLAGIASCTVMALRSPTAWNVDFNEFYSAGKLVGTGRLYDWSALRPIELEHTLQTVPFGRIPAFAVAFLPFSVMPYTLARILWLILGFAALAAVVALWPLSRWERLAAAMCWSVPSAMCLAFGQDSVLFLFFVALGLAFLRKGHDFCAVVALSACAAKPHLALLLPVLLAARGKWKSIQGGMVGGAVMLLVSFAVEGVDWPARLLALSRAPEFNPAPDRMPTLAGLLAIIGGSLPVQIAVSITVVAACWVLSRRLPLAPAMALALAGGLLISPHAYGYDALLLLPALMLPFEAGHPLWNQTWAVLLMTPLPYLILLSPRPTAGHLAVSGFTLMLFALELYRVGRSAHNHTMLEAAVGPSTRKPVGPT